MLRFLTLCVLGVVVTAQPPPPMKCCVPMRFEATVGEVAAWAGMKPGYVIKNDMISYDFESKKFAVVSRYEGSDGKFGEYRYIHDFTRKMRYFIADGQCNSTKSEYMMEEFCMPSDARKLGDFHVGLGRHNTLATSSYYRKGTHSGLNHVSVVTTRGCIPVYDTTWGMVSNLPLSSTHGFYNAQATIRDPDVFKPPMNCKMLPPSDVPKVVTIMQSLFNA